MAKAGTEDEGRVVKFRKPKDPGPPVLASFDPDQMGPEFDVIVELTERRDLYAAGQDAVQTTIRSFPSMCFANIDRLRASFSGNRPGLNPTVAACLHWGLRTLMADDSVRAFVAARQRFNVCDTTIDPTAYSIMREMFRDLGLGLESGPRLTLRVPTPVHEEIGALASDLGLRVEMIVGLASYVTLAEQNTTIRAHAKVMRTSIDEFLKRLSIRSRVIGVVMRELDIIAGE